MLPMHLAAMHGTSPTVIRALLQAEKNTASKKETTKQIERRTTATFSGTLGYYYGYSDERISSEQLQVTGAKPLHNSTTI